LRITNYILQDEGAIYLLAMDLILFPLLLGGETVGDCLGFEEDCAREGFTKALAPDFLCLLKTLGAQFRSSGSENLLFLTFGCQYKYLG
jgi:hypothetical protein